MNIFKLLLVGVCASFFFSGCVTAKPEATAQPGATAQEERHDVLYACNCGPECKCNAVSTKPGKCGCGAPLVWGHVIRVEGNEAIVCQCKEGCKCAGLDPKDPSKCACGNPVKRVNLQGTGLFFCNCGGACGCNTLSHQPGSCKCGMPLKKAD